VPLILTLILLDSRWLRVVALASETAPRPVGRLTSTESVGLTQVKQCCTTMSS